MPLESVLSEPPVEHPADVAPPPDALIERTYRWRRREVVRTRITWVGLVTVLLLLVHKQVVLLQPGIGITGKAAWFIGVVVVPVLLLLLWRAGLLPPERVAMDGEPDEGAPVDAPTGPKRP